MHPKYGDYFMIIRKVYLCACKTYLNVLIYTLHTIYRELLVSCCMTTIKYKHEAQQAFPVTPVS